MMGHNLKKYRRCVQFLKVSDDGTQSQKCKILANNLKNVRFLHTISKMLDDCTQSQHMSDNGTNVNTFL